MAQDIAFADGVFDLALMLKSLHHVPPQAMARALAETARVLRPGGHLYVSEPVYAGDFNDIIRLFNDEREVRAAAQRAVDEALDSGRWDAAAERRFVMPSKFRDFAEFEERVMRPTFVDHRLDESMVARVRERFLAHQGQDGAAFTVPVHVRLLRRRL